MGFKPRRVGLLPFTDGRGYGYVDLGGRVVVSAQYKSAQPFAHGMAAVKSARWGYIDELGELVIPCKYAAAMSFSSEGVAVVHAKLAGTNQVFHIDRQGARLSDDVSLNAGAFCDGLGRMMTSSKRWQFIDRQGQVAIGPQTGELGDFSEGLAPYAARFGGSWGYIDRTGEIAIEPTFRDVGAFVDGVAPVLGAKGTLSIIDRGGRTVATCDRRVDSFGRITDGLLRVKIRGQGTSWIDPEGRVAIEGPFATAEDFTPEGYAMAAVAFDQRGVIDRSGAWALEPRYWGMGAITSGCAMVYPSAKKRSLYGWVRLSNRQVIWKPETLEL